MRKKFAPKMSSICSFKLFVSHPRRPRVRPDIRARNGKLARDTDTDLVCFRIHNTRTDFHPPGSSRPMWFTGGDFEQFGADEEWISLQKKRQRRLLPGETVVATLRQTD